MIENKVIDLVVQLSAKEDIQVNHTLQDDLALDSLTMVTMLIEIENIFSIQLNESDMNPFDLITVQDVINLVEKYGGEINA